MAARWPGDFVCVILILCLLALYLVGGCNFAAIHLTKGPKPEASRIHVIHVIISSCFAYVLWETKKPQISLGFCSTNPLRPSSSRLVQAVVKNFWERRSMQMSWQESWAKTSNIIARTCNKMHHRTSQFLWRGNVWRDLLLPFQTLQTQSKVTVKGRKPTLSRVSPRSSEAVHMISETNETNVNLDHSNCAIWINLTVLLTSLDTFLVRSLQLRKWRRLRRLKDWKTKPLAF